MDKPVDQMSFEEIEAERAKIAAERADLERQRAERASQRLAAVIDGKDVDGVIKPTFTLEPGYVTPGPEVYDAVDASGLPTPTELMNAEMADEAPAEPEPWPHQHMVHMGMELDVRIPNQSALMAVSMLQQLDGLGQLQMEIFNTFLANHLSQESLAKVVMELLRPDSEMSIQSLVQALVNMRLAEIEAS